jgi:hypothetical protein
MILEYNNDLDTLEQFLQQFHLKTNRQNNSLHYELKDCKFIIIPLINYSALIIFCHRWKKLKCKTNIYLCIRTIYGCYFKEIVLTELLETWTEFLFSLQTLCFFQMSTLDLHNVHSSLQFLL